MNLTGSAVTKGEIEGPGLMKCGGMRTPNRYSKGLLVVRGRRSGLVRGARYDSERALLRSKGPRLLASVLC